MKEGRKRKKKRKKRRRRRRRRWGVHVREREREREREIVVVMLGLIRWILQFFKYLQKCYWVILLENWKLERGVF